MEVEIADRIQTALLARRERIKEWQEEQRQSEGDGAGFADGLPALGEIDHALERIEDGTLGMCTVCHERVDDSRLELDFTASVCLEHYSDDQRRLLERDLELAAQVQQYLFPVGAPPMRSTRIAAHAQPAHIVSGDYFDYFRFRENMQGVAIADVMGKGLAASLLMANLQASLRILGPEHDRLDALALRLNGLFQHNLRLIRFISLVLLAVDEEAGVLEYVNAGHNAPLLFDAASSDISRLPPSGPALGIMPDPAFATRRVDFRPGDVAVLFTDGVVEARDAGGQQFGETGVADYLARHHEESADAIALGLRNAVASFADGRLEDDRSLLVLKRGA
jgi:sigma-B regulation protein RsbU (phosphoserine phosphatase)